MQRLPGERGLVEDCGPVGDDAVDGNNLSRGDDQQIGRFDGVEGYEDDVVVADPLVRSTWRTFEKGTQIA